MDIHNQKYLAAFRKGLRSKLTIAEALFWRELKCRKLAGFKFRRQHSVGNYILDFYCASKRLAIELDGEIHNDPSIKENDRIRTEFLKTYGIKVLRFENVDVVKNVEGVLEAVKKELV
ncbi:MAG: endonuclease domain-containing protein [Candidatus Pedobacter colombiensis]|uniref:Endonuclease domain-containing protein n=1 Tax=Candidatus Pedobacter colombiensis TaxID=3121371 RepID=A0AAJ6B4P4_9SPHI|nr:endonuclease domain-containing protein [Pedobacter sp.]WEK17837.1 MAG: endonuclease domain-containing protein [Pedobacter sp.]